MLEQYEQALDAWIATKVAQGDDDELFASGYLQGHVAVVLAQLEQEGRWDSQGLEDKMQACLATARSELQPDDLLLVEKAWGELRAQLLPASELPHG